MKGHAVERPIATADTFRYERIQDKGRHLDPHKPKSGCPRSKAHPHLKVFDFLMPRGAR